MDELVSLDAARKAGLMELQRYLDEAGGIASAKHAGAALLLDVLSLIASYSTHRRTNFPEIYCATALLAHHCWRHQHPLPLQGRSQNQEDVESGF